MTGEVDLRHGVAAAFEFLQLLDILAGTINVGHDAGEAGERLAEMRFEGLDVGLGADLDLLVENL